MEVRETGRESSERERGRSGRTKEDCEARLLGRESLVSERLGRGPKERREMPDVERRATCLEDEDCEGVLSSVRTEEVLAVLPMVRLRLRIVTLEGMWVWPIAEPLRGEARGGVLMGAGSFERADWTRCSSFCICAVRVRMCVRDCEFGMPRVAGAFVLAFLMTDGVAFLFRDAVLGAGGPLEARKFPDGSRLAAGFGVVLESPDGSFNLLFGRFKGVFATGFVVFDDSDIGGDGGVGVSDTVSTVETDFVSGGVVTIGDEPVDVGEPSSYAGELGAVISVASEASWRFRNLSCMTSASILRSPSSSRSRCVSIRRFSRSCSPTLISSSNITALSIATLYFDSKSSYEDVVFLAWRSKSSFATSISRNRCCSVLF